MDITVAKYTMYILSKENASDCVVNLSRGKEELLACFGRSWETFIPYPYLCYTYVWNGKLQKRPPHTYYQHLFTPTNLQLWHLPSNQNPKLAFSTKVKLWLFHPSLRVFKKKKKYQNTRFPSQSQTDGRTTDNQCSCNWMPHNWGCKKCIQESANGLS